jgi:hypothetical protein
MGEAGTLSGRTRRWIFVGLLAAFSAVLLGTAVVLGPDRFDRAGSSDVRGDTSVEAVEVGNETGGVVSSFSSPSEAAAHLRGRAAESLRGFSEGRLGDIETLKAICADTDEVLSGDIGGITPSDRQSYFDAQMEVLDARAAAIGDLAERSGRAELQEYSRLLSELDPLMKKGGPESLARPQGRFLEVALMISALEEKLGNPCP